MMERVARWSFVAWVVVALGTGCGQSVGKTGSNTNWLMRCNADGDCGTQGTCWCGACTSPCDTGDVCHGDGTCHASDELGCHTPSGKSVCVAECATSTDCPQEKGLDCVQGACLPAAGGAAGRSSGGGGVGGSGAGAGGATSDSNIAGGASVGGELVPDGAKLSVSARYACYVWDDAGDKRIDCWGDSASSPATLPAVGAYYAVLPPQRVANVIDPVAVAVSTVHACALTQGGDVYCWGRDSAGQIGVPSTPDTTCPDFDVGNSGSVACQPEPQRVENVQNAVRIAVSETRSCALLADGSVTCWGDVAKVSDWVSGVSQARGIALSNAGICVIDANDRPACSFDSRLNGSFGELDALALSDGGSSYDFACTLGSDRSVICVGDDTFGQLGVGMESASQDLPVAVSDATAIAVGINHACALGTDGKVRCWGANDGGQVSTPPRTSPACGILHCEPRPLEVVGLPPIVALAAGGGRACGLAADRTLWCWGKPASDHPVLERVSGPWEANAPDCEERLATLDSKRLDAVLSVDVGGSCTFDSQCSLVSVDLSCAHSCALVSVATTGSRLKDKIAALEADYCGDAAGCSVPDVACPPPTTQAVCVGGFCTQTDIEHSGCDDTCGCEAVTSASAPQLQSTQCPGFDLVLGGGIACGACTGATLAFVVTNQGGARFAGDATLEFGYPSDDVALAHPDALPAPISLTLELEPGAVSAPIHVAGPNEFEVTMTLRADGDCVPENNVMGADFPAPGVRCP